MSFTGFNTNTSGGGFGSSSGNTKVFGSTNTVGGFGSNTQSGNAFGSTGFGSTGMNQGGNAFGGSGTGVTFGTATTTPSDGFGSSGNAFGKSNTGGGFGSTNLSFGSSNMNNFSGSTFGSTNNTFGGTSNTGGFGTGNTGFGLSSPSGGVASNTGNSMFGAPNNTGFGSSTFPGSTSTDGFGMNKNTQSPFNNTSGTTPMFGSGSNVGSVNSGSGPAYQTTPDPNSVSNEHLISITAMPHYESLSLEQLRWADYCANNGQKPVAQQTGTTSGFGTQNSSFGMQGTSNVFGGSNLGSTFGQTQQNSGSLFGNSSSQNSFGAFGSSQAQSNSGSMFGSQQSSSFGTPSQQQQQGSAFGAPQQSTTFGTTSQQTSVFSAPSQQSSSVFGSTQPQSGSLFSSTSQPQQQGVFGNAPSGTSGSLFSNQSTPAVGTASSLTFGTGQTQSGSLFGSTTSTGGGLFGGAKTESTLGTTSTGGSLFGSSTSQSGQSTFGSQPSGSLFGTSSQPSSQTSLFGNTGTTAQASTLGQPQQSQPLFGSGTGQSNSLFGNSTQQQSSLFSGATPTQATGSLFGAPQQQASTSLLSTGTQQAQQPSQLVSMQSPQQSLQVQQALLEQQQQLILASGSPYATGATSQMAKHIELAREAWQPVVNESKRSSDATTRLVSNGVAQPNSIKTRTMVPYRSPIGPMSMRQRSYNRTYSALVQTGNTAPETDQSKGAGASLGRSIDFDGKNVLGDGVFDLSKKLSIKKAGRENGLENLKIANTPSYGSKSYGKTTGLQSETKDNIGSPPLESSLPVAAKDSYQDRENDTHSDQIKKSPLKPHKTGNRVLSPLTAESDTESDRKPRPPLSPDCPTISQEYLSLGYTISPSMAKLRRMTGTELSQVSDFSVAREGFGKVQWLGQVDIRGLIVDDVFEIEHMNVEVYKSESDTPERGTKLNKPAICTIYNVEIPANFAGTLGEWVEWLREDYTPKTMDAQWIDFDEKNMTWIFAVKHFTKYGFSQSTTPYPTKGSVRVSENLQTTDTELPVSIEGLVDKAPDSLSPTPASDSNVFSNTADLLQSTLGAFSAGDSSIGMEDSSFPLQKPLSLPKAEQSVIGDFPSLDCVVVDVESTFSEDQHPLSSGPVMSIFEEVESTLSSSKDNNTLASRHVRRSFGVSWGPNGEIAFPCGNSRVQIMVIDAGASAELERLRLDVVMQGALSNVACNEQEMDSDGVVFNMVEALMWMEVAEMSVHERFVWSLVHALWFAGKCAMDRVPIADECMQIIEWCDWADALPTKNEEARLNQNTILSEYLDSLDTWLKKSLTIDTDIGGNEVSLVVGWQEDIALALSCKQIDVAAELSMSRGDFVLATLISQAAGDTRVRKILSEQLRIWEKSDCLQYMSSELVNVYRLLSGDIETEQAKDGEHWLRSLALNFWYCMDPLDPIEIGLSKYYASFTSGLCPPPRMPWWNSDVDGQDCYDTLYSLLCLATREKEIAFQSVLDPRGHSPRHIDFGMQWSLNRILRSLGIFGLTLDELSEYKLTMSYAFELECIGRWWLAVFVVQFLPGVENRERATKEILRRHVNESFYLSSPVSDDSDSAVVVKEFLLNQVGLKPEWLAEAIALHARYTGASKQEIAQFGAAKDLNQYLSAVVDKVAPSAVLSGDTSKLLELLEPYIDEVCRAALSGLPWAIKSRIFLEYAQLHVEKSVLIEQMSKFADVPESVSQLESAYQEFMRRVCSLAEDVLHCRTCGSHLELQADVSAEIGDWLRARITEGISLQYSLGIDLGLEKYGAIHLSLPGRDESIRASIDQFALQFVEIFLMDFPKK